jgi:hypothetical protein
MKFTAEGQRLEAADDRDVPWRRWGPYLSDRQWGTVREDYSDNGDAWSYFTHDQARSPSSSATATLMSSAANRRPPQAGRSGSGCGHR